MGGCISSGTVEYEVRKKDEFYPFIVPKIKLEGISDDNPRCPFFDFGEEKIILNYNEKYVYELAIKYHMEVMANDAFGNEIWVDGGKVVDEQLIGIEIKFEKQRCVCDRSYIRYDLEKQEKEIFKIALDSTSPMSEDDLKRFAQTDEKNNEAKKEFGDLKFSY